MWNLLKEKWKKLKIKLFGCKHIWLNQKQDNTSDTMLAPSVYVSNFHDFKTQIEQNIKREFYLGTTIIDKCAICGQIRSEMIKERIKQTARESDEKVKHYQAQLPALGKPTKNNN